MKKYGMLMTPDLAQKAHDGDKTVTRRLIKPQPQAPVQWFSGNSSIDMGWWEMAYDSSAGWYPWSLRKPRYRPGMIVSVKETHWRYGHYERNEKGNWRFMPCGVAAVPVLFQAPEAQLNPPPRKHRAYHKRPNLFLPFDYARTHIEILSVRPERVQEITAEDAKREGVTFDGIRELLEPFATADVRPFHWIHGADDGEVFCDECIDAAVAKVKKADPKNADDFSRDGGWTSAEGEEGPVSCTTCEKLLDYTLSDGGRRAELNHFKEHGFDLTNSQEAYELQQIFVEADCIEDEDLKDRVYMLGFFILWDSINPDYPMASNPWDWRYAFKRVEKP